MKKTLIISLVFLLIQSASGKVKIDPNAPGWLTNRPHRPGALEGYGYCEKLRKRQKQREIAYSDALRRLSEVKPRIKGHVITRLSRQTQKERVIFDKRSLDILTEVIFDMAKMRVTCGGEYRDPYTKEYWVYLFVSKKNYEECIRQQLEERQNQFNLAKSYYFEGEKCILQKRFDSAKELFNKGLEKLEEISGQADSYLNSKEERIFLFSRIEERICAVDDLIKEEQEEIKRKLIAEDSIKETRIMLKEARKRSATEVELKKAEEILSSALQSFENKHYSRAILLANNAKNYAEIVKNSICSKCKKTGLCSVCKKRGKIICSHCNGLGQVTKTCPECHGDGKEECRGFLFVSGCNGRGYRSCPRCGIRGYIKKWCAGGTYNATCNVCSGTGRGSECQLCNGTGRSGTCSHCKGKRTITEKCSYCSETGKIICPNCGGSGVCPACTKGMLISR
jgi:tetratricopeptide (TPR) repeat protein